MEVGSHDIEITTNVYDDLYKLISFPDWSDGPIFHSWSHNSFMVTLFSVAIWILLFINIALCRWSELSFEFTHINAKMLFFCQHNIVLLFFLTTICSNSAIIFNANDFLSSRKSVLFISGVLDEVYQLMSTYMTIAWIAL